MRVQWIKTGVVVIVAAVTAAASALTQAAMEPAVDKALSRLAEDLARVEAKLAAIQGLEGGSVPSNGTQPLAYAPFCSRVEAIANSAIPLAIAPISQETFEAWVNASAGQRTAATTNDDGKKGIETEQIALWGRLAIGAFLARECELKPLYRQRIKSPASTSEDATTRSKRRVLDEAVKAVRMLAFHTSVTAEMLAGVDNKTDLSAVAESFAALAEAIKPTTANYRQATMSMAETAATTAPDKERLQTLTTTAKDLLTSLDGACRTLKQLGATGGDDRVRGLKQLQDDLLSVGDACAKLEALTSGLAEGWNVELSDEMLAPINKPAPAKTKQTMKNGKSARTAAAELTTIFPEGASFAGRWLSESGWQNISGTITDSSPNAATMRFENDYGRWDLKFEVVDGRIKLRNCIGIGRAYSGGSLSTITNIRVSGSADIAVQGGSVRLAGTWDWSNPDTRTGKQGVETAFEFTRK